MNKSYSKIRHIQESNIKLEERMLNEQKQIIKTIVNKFIKSKPKPQNFNAGYKTPPNRYFKEIELPPNVKNLLKTLPNKVKVELKLNSVFQKNKGNADRLYQYIKKLHQNSKTNTFNSMSTDAETIKRLISTQKGEYIDLNFLYKKLHELKSQIETARKLVPIPKEGGILNKNKKYGQQLNDRANYLWDENILLNNIIGDLESVLKDIKFK
jgi:hypothetical protein